MGFVTSEVLLLPKRFPNPAVALNPPEVLGFALGRNNEGLECSLCAPQHGLLFTSYLKKQESLFPFLLSDGEAIPGSPCYGVLPLFSRRCLFMDSYNHFFSCQHYFKHKDFLCWCLSPQNNDRLQSDPWRALASLGAATLHLLGSPLCQPGSLLVSSPEFSLLVSFQLPLLQMDNQICV